MKSFQCCVVVVLVTGCSHAPPHAPRVPPPVAAAPVESQPLTPPLTQLPAMATPMDVPVPLIEEIRLIADTQIHESRGAPSRYWSRAVDGVVPVTIRSAQQVLGATDLLYDAITEQAFPLTLHLGDAMDVSCQTEWDMFAMAMQRGLGVPGSGSWLYTPGNHDGYLVGNFVPNKRFVYKDPYWSRVCNAGRANTAQAVVHDRMSKDQVIRAYLALLPGARSAADTGRFCLPDHALCVAYAVSASRPWTSFVVQLVRLPGVSPQARPVYALLLDTSNYTASGYDKMTILAGVTGNVSMLQIEAARKLVQDLPPAARYFIAAHHPWKQWKTNTWPAQHASALEQLFSDRRFLPLLVTAHTHAAGRASWKLGSAVFEELNIGSLIDPPAYYRTLQFKEHANGQIDVVTKAVFSAGDLEKCASFNLPLDGSGYSVNDQDPRPTSSFGAFSGTLKKFIRFKDEKHVELNQQLLAYADTVDQSGLAEPFSFNRFGATGPRTFAGAPEVAGYLRYLARCPDRAVCSLQEKGQLLYALDKTYWALPGSAEQFRRAHLARSCYALQAIGQTGSLAGTADQVQHQAMDISTITLHIK